MRQALLCIGLPVILTKSTCKPTSAVHPLIKVVLVPRWNNQFVVFEFVHWLPQLFLAIGNLSLGGEVLNTSTNRLEHSDDSDSQFNVAPQLGTVVVAKDLLH